MTEIQFHFDPVPPNSGGGGKFPWKTVLIGVGLLALLVAIAYVISKPVSADLPDIQQDYDPETNDQ